MNINVSALPSSRSCLLTISFISCSALASAGFCFKESTNRGCFRNGYWASRRMALSLRKAWTFCMGLPWRWGFWTLIALLGDCLQLNQFTKSRMNNARHSTLKIVSCKHNRAVNKYEKFSFPRSPFVGVHHEEYSIVTRWQATYSPCDDKKNKAALNITCSCSPLQGDKGEKAYEAADERK